ncbi:polysaccharide deacetylase family protein [Veillonella criceti]|uniref:Poly-beta-1,6-N-acetyl-D-glucosamine N-deacetylase n=1 Tax=Veillonella criceti TaxID=103891 RepID=A0A380NI14_9FIRM|nr:polysaccharide deacetylase family protein [Veillonella criceti]SUP40171.1 Poly-beta-1,6-N-acetyl-D-glucosamine N-deacetylase precursor [Veillonella criceti]
MLQKVLKGIGILVVLIAFIIGAFYVTAPIYSLRGIPVLNYHQVNDEKFSPLTMKTSDFDAQMAYLHNQGYHAITLNQLYNYLQHNVALPEKPVVITFDDGYVDNYEEAMPILQKYGMKATLFMIGDSIGAPGFLNAEQLKAMESNHIFDVESHTYTHKDLRSMSGEAVITEFTKSKQLLESVLGHPVEYIAYPCGFTTPQVDQLAQATGYRLAFTVDTGNVNQGENDFNLDRVPVFEGDNPLLSMKLRLHYVEIIGGLWALRDFLRDHNQPTLAALVPLF